jgi:hypothetical protein
MNFVSLRPFAALGVPLCIAMTIASGALAQTSATPLIEVTAQPVSPRTWSLQGAAGMATAAKHGCTSNAGGKR